MSWNTNKAIDELVRGRELTNQLRDLLNKSTIYDSGMVGGEDLVTKICNTFANTISILKSTNSYGYDNNMKVERGNKMSYDGRKSEDSDENIKSSPSASASASVSPRTRKDERVSYKSKRRRSVAVGRARRNIASALIDDGYAWRKYGQKQILNSNYPRSYYRCTHKEQGCVATKQVQMIEDDPPKYETIYLGDHTCKHTLNSSYFIVDDHPISNHSSIILSFANPFLSSVKLQDKEDDKTISYNESDHLHHLSTFDPSTEMSVLSADHDVIFGVVDSVLDLDEFLEC